MAGNIDVENDGLYLRHLLHDTGYPEIGDIIKRALDSVIPRKAVDFRTNVAGVITQCLQSNGVPMFRTRYAKQPFPENTVLMVCYMGRLKGSWLKNTPPEDMQLLRSKGDGYTLMLRKYGQYPAGPAGTVSIGGAAAYTGQAIVSEAIDELRYFLSGQQVDFEEFSKSWLREFPNLPVPTEPMHRIGREYTFRIGYGTEMQSSSSSALEQKLMDIETKLEEALADEEKAVLFYRGLQYDIIYARELNPTHMPASQRKRESDRYLYSTQEGVGNIGTEEARHKRKIGNMIKAIQELRKTLELERTTGKQQWLKPLERV